MSNTVIQLKKSATPGSSPAALANGEIAINYADGKLYYRNTSNYIVSISGSGSGTSGNYFGTVNANGTLLIADISGDTLGIYQGDNIIITSDAINDTLTISANLTVANNWSNTKVASVTSNSTSRIWANTIVDANQSKNVFIDLATSGVTATTYGGSTQIPYFTVDSYGRITAAANVAITAGSMDYAYVNNAANSANSYASSLVSSPAINIGTSPPVSATLGSLWWNSVSGRLFVYYTDADSSQWVETSPSGGTVNISSIVDNVSPALSNVFNAAFVAANAAFAAANAKVDTITSNSTTRIWANSVTVGSIETVYLDLANSGVTANTYGGATQIPYFTVDSYGRITSAANVTVQGMDYAYANTVANNSNLYAASISSKVNVSTTGPTGNTNGALWWNTNLGRLLIYYTDADSSQWVDASPSGGLSNTGVVASTYGGSTNIPVLVVDAYGRITTASNVAVQGMDYAYANGVVNAANAWANTKLANTSGVSTAGNITISGYANSTYTYDSKGDVRDIPVNNQIVGYTLAIGDTGKFISTNTSIFVPNAVFSAGQNITLYNNSSASISITSNSSVTMYLSGTSNTSVRNLSQRGLATILCVAANNFVISGSGLS